MEIVLQLSFGLARFLQGDASRDEAGPAIDELERALEELGISVRPVHPNAQDAELETYFTVDADGPSRTDEICRRLNAVEGVSAYAKTAAEAPESM